jgi:peptidylprolyl isomerase
MSQHQGILAAVALLSFALAACAPGPRVEPPAVDPAPGASTATVTREAAPREAAPKEAAASSGNPAPPIPPPPDLTTPPADAQTTSSGLVFKVLTPGKGGARPKPTDLVTVHYTGWAANEGKMLDSSVQRGKPVTASLNYMIKGWREALPEMTVGEKRRLWLTESLAFEGNPTAPRGMIVYDVELIGVEQGPAVAPLDVATPPADVQRSPTGLAWKVLRPGTGDRSPTEASTVTVHYTGWTPKGTMVDSSVARGKPVTFVVSSVLKGWQEALRQMVVGERRRLWVPARLAFEGREGLTQGDLTYDLELIEVKD